jgi:hypothetical protein
MKFTAIIVVVFALLGTSAFGGEEEEGWIQLFDGKTLKGWKASERPENWNVEDGVLKGTGERSHLFWTGGELVDFELKIDVKTTPGSNSGIFFHTAFQDGGWPSVGYETQINNSHGDPVRTGSIYNVVKLYESDSRDNEWWTQHLIVKGKNVVVKVDGKIVIDFTEPEGVTGTRKLGKGTIALQQHDPGSVVFFKNIKLKKLD